MADTNSGITNAFSGEDNPFADLVPEGGVARPATVSEALGRGIDQYQGMAYGAAEAAGELTGLKSLTEFGREGRERNKLEAQVAAPPKQDFTDADGIGKLFQWGKETLVENLPNIGQSVAGATAGAYAGAFGGPYAPITVPLGALVGAIVPNYVLGVGEVQGAIKDRDPTAVQPGMAFAGGAAIAALDSIVPGKIGSSLVRTYGRGMAEEIATRALAKHVSPTVLKEAGKDGLIEGVTESVQEVIKDLTAATATGQGLDPNLGTNLVESFAAGLLTGGVMGGGRQAATRIKSLDAKPVPPSDPSEPSLNDTNEPIKPRTPTPTLADTANPGQPVTLYRGEPDPSTFDPRFTDNARVGRWYTADVEEARGFAGPGGRVFELEVPADKLTQVKRSKVDDQHYTVPKRIQGRRKVLEIVPAETAESAPQTESDSEMIPVDAGNPFADLIPAQKAKPVAQKAPVEIPPAVRNIERLKAEADDADPQSPLAAALDQATRIGLIHQDAVRSAVWARDNGRQDIADAILAKAEDIAIKASQNAADISGPEMNSWADNARKTYEMVRGAAVGQTGADADPTSRQAMPQDLLQYIRARGGIQDQDGELRAMDAHKRSGLINNKRGVAPDKMRELLVEDGFLADAPYDQESTSTTNDLYDLVDRALRGEKIYREADREVAEIARGQQYASIEQEQEEYQITQSIRQLYDEMDIPYPFTAEEEAEVVALVRSGMPVDEAIEREAADWNNEVELNEAIRGRTSGDRAATESGRGARGRSETRGTARGTGSDVRVVGEAREDEILAAVGGRSLPEEVWGPKFQKLMSGQYKTAVASDDLSTQLDILTAKYFNAPNDPPEMRAAMGREIMRLRDELGPEWMAKYAPDAQPIALGLPKPRGATDDGILGAVGGDDEFSRLIADTKRKNDYAADLVARELAKPFPRISTERGGKKHVLTKDPERDGFRITAFDDQGPMGHVEYSNTPQDIRRAGSDLLSRGLVVPDRLDDSPEARKARAEAEGFTVIGYRGLNHPYDEAVAGDRNWQMFVRNPSVASGYAGDSDGANVVPARLRLGKNLAINAQGARWDRIQGRDVPYQFKRDARLPMDPVYSVGEIARAAKRSGYDSLTVENVVDTNHSTDTTSSTVDVIFEAKNVRSVNAKFDPSRRDSADLLAAVGGEDEGGSAFDDASEESWQDTGRRGTANEWANEQANAGRARQGPADRTALEREATSVMEGIRRLEKDLRAKKSSPEQIAEAIQSKFGLSVSADEISKGNVWWRIDEILDDEKGTQIRRTPARVQQVADAYRGTDLTYAEIAGKMSQDWRLPVTETWVKNTLVMHGIRRLASAKRNPLVHERWTPERVKVLTDMFAQGLGDTEIARSLGQMPGANVAPENVYRHRQVLGLSRGKSSRDLGKIGTLTQADIARLESGEFADNTAAEIAQILSRPDKARGLPARDVTRNMIVGMWKRLREAKMRAEFAPNVPIPTSMPTRPRTRSYNAAIDDLLRDPASAGKSVSQLATEASQLAGRPVTGAAIYRRRFWLKKAGSEPMFAAGWFDPEKWLKGLRGKDGNERPDGGQPAQDSRGRDPASGVAAGRPSEAGRGTDAGRGLDGDGRGTGSPRLFRLRGYVGRSVETIPTAKGLGQRFVFLHPEKAKVTTGEGRSAAVTVRQMRSVPNWVARAQVVEVAPGEWTVRDIKVRKNHRMRGLGNELLTQIEEDIGSDLLPPSKMTRDLFRVWTKRDPESVEAYSRYQGDYYSRERLGKMQQAAERIALLSTDTRERNAAIKQEAEIQALLDTLAATDDPDAAFGAPTVDDHMRKLAYSAIRMNKPFVVSQKTIDAVHEGLKPHMHIVPSGVPVGTLARIEPVEGEAGVPTARFVFNTADGDEVHLTGSVDKLLRYRAGFVPSRGGEPASIVFFRLSLPEHFGNSLRGELAHEVTHAIRRKRVISKDAWGLLLGHAKSLGVLDYEQRGFLQAIGNPTYRTVPTQRTLREVYQMDYAGRSDFDEIMDQEEVTHLVELYIHNQLPKSDIDPVRDILDGILDGKRYGRGQGASTTPESDQPAPRRKRVQVQGELPLWDAALHDDVAITPDLDMSPEAKKQRAVEQGWKTWMTLYHGTGSDIPAFDLRKAQDKEGRRRGLGLGKGKIYLTSTGENASGWAMAAPDRKLGKTPNVIPVWVRGDLIDESDYHEKFKEFSGGKLPSDSTLDQKTRDRLIEQTDDWAKAQGYTGIQQVYRHHKTGEVTEYGQTAMFDPRNIRSPNAAFDPANADSADLLASNPGDTNGMRQFYGSDGLPGEDALTNAVDFHRRRGRELPADERARLEAEARPVEGIVPKNLRKILEKLDKDSAKPQRIDTLETPSSDKAGMGFTLFPLTDVVKASVLDDGQPLFAMGGRVNPTKNTDPKKRPSNIQADNSNAAAPQPPARSFMGRIFDPDTAISKALSLIRRRA